MANLQEELNRALQYYHSGNPAEAARICRRVLESDRRNADLWCFFGVALRAAGDAEQAITSYQQALKLRPSFVEAWNNLGNALVVLGRLEEAATAYTQLLRLRPDSPEAHNNYGALLRKKGQITEAGGHYQEALRLKPDYPDAHNNLGDALASLNRHEEAIASYRAALRLKPNYPEAHTNLGNSLVRLEKIDEGIAHHHEALRLRPDYVEGHCNLGNAFAAQKNYPAAESSYRESIRLRPDYPEGHHNLGTALAELGRLVEAERAYREALRLKADYPDALGNLATCLVAQGRPADAIGVYDFILQRKPNDAEAHMGKAFSYLVQGDYERGWQEYEWRWRTKDFGSLLHAEKPWDGAPVDGRTILVSVEQGLGDTFFAVRYAAKVKERGGHVVFTCQRPLLRLLSRCRGIDQLLESETAVPPFDYHVPMMSLPYVFRTTLATIPREVPYIFPDPELVEQWQKELPPDGVKKVGVIWQGNPGFKGDRQRSFPLADLAPLAAVEGVRLYSLQKGFGSEQLVTAPFPVIDLASHLDLTAGAFMDTAAVLQHLDLVITCDSALTHLAGALGVRTWLALPYAPHWLWLQNRDDSPWYPSVRLFRQQKWGDWADVFRRLAAELAALAARSA
jgi:Flp pilus assembly protein TadD